MKSEEARRDPQRVKEEAEALRGWVPKMRRALEDIAESLEDETRENTNRHRLDFLTCDLPREVDKLILKYRKTADELAVERSVNSQIDGERKVREKVDKAAGERLEEYEDALRRCAVAVGMGRSESFAGGTADAVEDFARRYQEALGRISGAVNRAGAFLPSGSCLTGDVPEAVEEALARAESSRATAGRMAELWRGALRQVAEVLELPEGFNMLELPREIGRRLGERESLAGLLSAKRVEVYVVLSARSGVEGVYSVEGRAEEVRKEVGGSACCCVLRQEGPIFLERPATWRATLRHRFTDPLPERLRTGNNPRALNLVIQVDDIGEKAFREHAERHMRRQLEAPDIGSGRVYGIDPSNGWDLGVEALLEKIVVERIDVVRVGGEALDTRREELAADICEPNPWFEMARCVYVVIEKGGETVAVHRMTWRNWGRCRDGEAKSAFFGPKVPRDRRSYDDWAREIVAKCKRIEYDVDDPALDCAAVRAGVTSKAALRWIEKWCEPAAAYAMQTWRADWTPEMGEEFGEALADLEYHVDRVDVEPPEVSTRVSFVAVDRYLSPRLSTWEGAGESLIAGWELIIQSDRFVIDLEGSCDGLLIDSRNDPAARRRVWHGTSTPWRGSWTAMLQENGESDPERGVRSINVRLGSPSQQILAKGLHDAEPVTIEGQRVVVVESVAPDGRGGFDYACRTVGNPNGGRGWR